VGGSDASATGGRRAGREGVELEEGSSGGRMSARKKTLSGGHMLAVLCNRATQNNIIMAKLN
jgi:hypothetical protein